MIPKIIHYCWFGGNALTKPAKKCIKSWKKYCSGCIIIEWNETNFDISTAPLYVQQAYEAKKWAFVSDYVRLYALTTMGGIYMDTDVEVLKPLDSFLNNKAFSGFEYGEYIQTAIMGSEKKIPLFEEFLKYYDNAIFINEDGTYNTKTNVQILTEILQNKGLVKNNAFQIIDGVALYPSEYFCPKSYFDGTINRTEKTHVIHHFDATWLTEEQRKNQKLHWKKSQKRLKQKAFRNKVKDIFIKIFGEEFYKKIRKI